MTQLVKPLRQEHVKVVIIKELIELLNDDESPYTVTQHLIHVMRAKGAKRPYEWDNNDFLIKLQEYKEELSDCIVNNDFEDGFEDNEFD